MKLIHETGAHTLTVPVPDGKVDDEGVAEQVEYKADEAGAIEVPDDLGHHLLSQAGWKMWQPEPAKPETAQAGVIDALKADLAAFREEFDALKADLAKPAAKAEPKGDAKGGAKA